MRGKNVSSLILCSIMFISKVNSVVLKHHEISKNDSEFLHKTEIKGTEDVKLIDDNLEPESGISQYTDDIYATSAIFKNTMDKEIDDGSGDENLEKIITTEIDNKTDSENLNIANQTTLFKEVSKTTEIISREFSKATRILPTNIIDEGSGDGIIQYTTENLTTKIVETSVKPTYVYEPIPENCLVSGCDTEIAHVIISEDSRLIPEGANLTLSCVSNNSNHNMLYWFKYNGSIYNLEAFGTENHLHLNIPNVKIIHSGIYKCIKWISRESCCNMESHIIVYEVPPYSYHLIIIGLVTAVFLILCITLVVRQSISFKKYTKQFSMKHGVKQQLL